MIISKRFFGILLVAAFSATAWALETDADGYYLIGSVQDWKDFAALVETTPTANAKMTADINLGDDQTMIGTLDRPYGGMFDGQGHTLTVDLYVTGTTVAPFRYVNGATLQRIHVAGSVHSTDVRLGGLVATGPNTTVKQCRVSALLTVDMITTGVRHSIGGIFSEPGENVVMEDCIFDGKIAEKNNHFCGGYVNYSPYTVTIRNSLNLGIFPPCTDYFSQTATFIRTDAGAGGSHVLTNVYYKNSFGIVQGTQVTSETLADGSVAYKLQNGRDDLVWGQRIGTDSEPVLTSDENYRVYKSKNGGYTNDPSEAYSGLQQDATDGYYLLGCLFDWQEFAKLVNDGTESAAKARMIADIDLGDDQTRIGDTREVEDGYFFEGVFDGQGHTLTIAYHTTDAQVTSDPQAPFTHIKGATIKNLHVDGTVATSHAHSAIVAWVRGGENVISNVWSSLKTTTSKSGWDECSAIVSWIGNATVTIKDCLFTGSITGTNGTSYNGCFIGWCQYSNDNTQVINCLSTGTFTDIGSCDPTRDRPHTNCYIRQFPTTIPESMQCTEEQLANGTITTALQDGREEKVWVQDDSTGLPILALFQKNNGIVTSLHIITDNDNGDWFSLDGRKLNGCPTEKGIYIHKEKKVIIK